GTEQALIVRNIPSGTQPVSGAVSITNFPGTQPVSGTVSVTQSGTWYVRAQDGSGNSLASSTITPTGAEQALIVRNIPSGTQPVSGSVSVSNFPATQPVSGSVSVSNFPATQTVSGNVNTAQSGTWSVRAQDGSGNNLASSTTTPVGTEQALIV